MKVARIISMLALGTILIFPQSSLAWGNYSDGSRVGNLYKFSYKGFIWKTWEGEMNLGGIHNEGNVTTANTWDFSLDSRHKHGEDTEKLAAQLNKALDDGKRVRIFYHQEIIVAWWRAKTDCLAYQVEEVK